MARLKDGRIEEAAALFAAALAHDPGNAGYATDLGFALGRLGRRAEAETLLRGAIEKDPHRVYAWVNLAEIYADDPTRWERRDAIVAFLEKGLDVLKEDRDRRFHLVLGPRELRARHRANRRGARAAQAAAGDRRRPAPVARRSASACSICWKPWRSTIARTRWRTGPGPTSPGRTPRRPPRPRAPSTADTATACFRSPRRLVQRYPTWAARARAARARLRGRRARRRGGARSGGRRQPGAVERAWRGARSARSWRSTAARWRRSAPTRRCATRSRWSRAGPTCASCATSSRGGAPRASTEARPGRATVPSEIARGLYQQAEEWIRVGDPVGLGRELLDQALADSPGFVAAAVSSYALTGKLPPATLEALKNDGPALWALASGVRKLGQTGKKAATSDDVEALVRPLIDRAVALDVQEARFARAIARAATGDRAGAARRPDRLRRARAEPRAPGRGAGAARRDRGSREPARRFAALAASCWRASACSRTSPSGRCARSAARARASCRPIVWSRSAWSTSTPIGWRRRASATRWPRRPAARRAPRRSRARRTSTRGCPTRSCARPIAARSARRPAARIGAAEWALARLAEAEGDRTDGARAHRARAGARRSAARPTATSGSRRPRAARPSVSPTACARTRTRAATAAPERARRSSAPWPPLPACSRAGAGAAARSRARCAAAPRCFPEVARAVDELRHDVLKHRASVLGLLADAERRRATRSSATMTEPRPTSVVVATIYDRLTQAALGHGVTLRPLAREPVFGALHTRSRPRRGPARRSRAARPPSSRRSTSACAVRTPTRSAALAAARAAHAPRRRDAVGLDRVGRGVGAAGGRRLDGARARRSPIWPSNSRSSTTRWPRSS